MKLNLKGEASNAVLTISNLRNCNVDTAIKHALGDEIFIQEKLADGYKVLLMKANVYSEVVW
jgi:hypothetical protein